MALADAWQLRAASVEYLPEGGGGHHWVLTGADGLRDFVTVDDLDGKDWLGGTRQAVVGGLRRALGTAGARPGSAGCRRSRPGTASPCAALTAGMPSRSSRSWPVVLTRSAPTPMS